MPTSATSPLRSLLAAWLTTRWKWLAVGLVLLAVVAAVSGRSPGSHTAATAAGSTATVPRSASGSSTTAPATPLPHSSANPNSARTASAPLTTTATPVTSAARATTAGTTPARAGTAVALLAAVLVKGRAPLTGYTRDRFGSAWKDVDHNGCDTRDDVLAAQLTHVITDGRCRVMSGSEADPYTNASLYYVRGRSTVDVDHVVALGDAWQTGAQQLSLATRTAFGNDPLNLLAVGLSANRAKGDADAASWLPKQRSYRCAYVARQVAVKARYHLWMTRAEHDAITGVLSGCPTQPAPTAGPARAHAPLTPPTPTRTARPTPKPTHTPAPTHAPTTTRTHTSAPTTTSSPEPMVVHPGAFCSPRGATGVSNRGTSMVCGPASDGRNRWHHG